MRSIFDPGAGGANDKTTCSPGADSAATKTAGTYSAAAVEIRSNPCPDQDGSHQEKGKGKSSRTAEDRRRCGQLRHQARRQKLKSRGADGFHWRKPDV